MNSSGIKTSTVLASFLLAACLSMRAEVKLPAIFSDGMVMQQQTNANLWGMATPNKKVTVTTGWNGKQYAVTADKNGSWKLSVSTPEAGGPYTITFDDRRIMAVLRSKQHGNADERIQEPTCRECQYGYSSQQKSSYPPVYGKTYFYHYPTERRSRFMERSGSG